MSNIIKSPFSRTERHLLNIKAIEQPHLLDSDAQDPLQLEHAINEKMKQAEEQASRIVLQAKEEADRIEAELQVKQAAFETECEILRNQEREQGFKQGYAEGQQQGQEIYKNKIDEVNRWSEEAENRYNSVIKDAEPQIIELALKIAGTITGSILDKESSSWLHLVKQALVEVKDQKHFKITVSPKWYTFLNEQKHELIGIIQDAPLFIYVNERFEENDCLIETPSGQLHAGVDSQLHMLKKALLSLLEGESE